MPDSPESERDAPASPPFAEPPFEAPPGMVWRWEIDGSWSTSPRSTGRCRYPKGDGTRKACGAPAVASFNRGRYDYRTMRPHPGWWDYCPDHMFGRVLVDFDGLPAVLQLRLRPAEGHDDTEWMASLRVSLPEQAEPA